MAIPAVRYEAYCMLWETAVDQTWRTVYQIGAACSMAAHVGRMVAMHPKYDWPDPKKFPPPDLGYK